MARGGAKLKVSFFGPLFAGDCWVLYQNDDYRWSNVGERDALIVRVRALGYDTSMLHFTAHG
jgi:apolipoprotein D and lipocalin family protein